MHALEVEGELLNACIEPRERPTIPVPRESGVHLGVTRVVLAAATIDVVTCDLSRDPRSEDFALARSGQVAPIRRAAHAREAPVRGALARGERCAS
ncbi:MAG: hypothetical protein KF850_10925 [Labilithrix sp.]|nr:hypothetical protein [Labilithrix sp.]